MIHDAKHMNILVAGGAGFIGTNLCSYLLEKGHDVTCVDNLYTGSIRNISSLLENTSFTYINADVRDCLCNRADLRGFDIVFNLACPASPAKYQEDPVQTLLTNVIGTKNLLDLASMCQATFVQASTSEIYGEPAIHPQSEQYYGNVNPNGLRSCYDEGKRAAESLVFDHSRMYGTRIKVARIFNTYGPYMAVNDGRVVSNFIVQALRNEQLTIYGHGRQTRSFCFVDDLVEGLWLLACSKDSFVGPVNIGNPAEISVRDLAMEISAATERDLELVFSELPADDPTRRKPDISLAKTMLGWEPRCSLSDGLAKTIAYFRDLPECRS